MSDIASEKSDLIRERGLPIEITMVRLTDIPNDIAKKLSKPKNCDSAMKMAEDLGGYPQKITALQYELSDDMRQRIADLPILTWSNVVDNSVVLVCKETKTKEYKEKSYNTKKQNKQGHNTEIHQVPNLISPYRKKVVSLQL